MRLIIINLIKGVGSTRNRGFAAYARLSLTLIGACDIRAYKRLFPRSSPSSNFFDAYFWCTVIKEVLSQLVNTIGEI